MQEMIPDNCRLLIIGGGAAGLAAACAAAEEGLNGIVLAERSDSLGGVLDQCVHGGFGLGYYRQNLTGVEYGRRWSENAEKYAENGQLKILTGTMALELSKDKRALLTRIGEVKRMEFDACILATGARERSIGSLPVAGTRPEGVYTAGQAQRMMNVMHINFAEKAVILGTGDIGQIVARHLIQHGKKVLCMVEQNSEPGGLARNRRECIEEYGIPVITNSTVTELHGEKVLGGVTVRNLLTGEERLIECDTLITSVGLIPERELLSKFANELPEWLECTGNAKSIHDIVDSVTEQGLIVGRRMAQKLK